MALFGADSSETKATTLELPPNVTPDKVINLWRGNDVLGVGSDVILLNTDGKAEVFGWLPNNPPKEIPAGLPLSDKPPKEGRANLLSKDSQNPLGTDETIEKIHEVNNPVKKLGDWLWVYQANTGISPIKTNWPASKQLFTIDEFKSRLPGRGPLARWQKGKYEKWDKIAAVFHNHLRKSIELLQTSPEK